MLNKIICIVGMAGAGKSLVADELVKQGFEYLRFGQITLDEVKKRGIEANPQELQKLFTQDRKEHLEKLIIPALKAGKTVISDRYFFSTFAYGVSDGLDLDELIKMNDNFLLPDLTFVFKVSPKVCIERIKKRGGEIKLFEKKEKLEKVWQIYEIVPNKFENVNMIEGEKTKEEVFSQIKEVVLSKILNIKI